MAAKKWGKETPILEKIIDIESENQQQKGSKQYIVIGTLYKDMHLRGSVSAAVLHTFIACNDVLTLLLTHYVGVGRLQGEQRNLRSSAVFVSDRLGGG